MRVALALIVVLGVALAGSFWGANLLRPSLNEETRAALQADGKAHQFAKIAAGTVHYRDEGDKRAPTIVLIHGFSTPSFVYEDYFTPLTDAGFRVVSFDLFGRGYSDRPNIPFGEDLFVGQVLGMINALNVSGPVHLVGYSMGGGVVADFSARHPELVASVTLLAPVGFSEVSDVPAYVKAPVIGDWLFRVLGSQLMAARLEDGLELAPNPDRFLTQFRERAAYAGYYGALLSTIRNYPMSPREPEHLTMVAAGMPVYSVWGDQDAVIPIDGKDNLLKWNPSAIVTVIEAGTHSITYSHADEITQILIDTLRPASAQSAY